MSLSLEELRKMTAAAQPSDEQIIQQAADTIEKEVDRAMLSYAKIGADRCPLSKKCFLLGFPLFDTEPAYERVVQRMRKRRFRVEPDPHDTSTLWISWAAPSVSQPPQPQAQLAPPWIPFPYS